MQAVFDLKSSASQHLFDIGAEHIAVALLHGSGRFAACEKLIAAAFPVHDAIYGGAKFAHAELYRRIFRACHAVIGSAGIRRKQK